MTLRGPSDSTSAETAGRNSEAIITGCSSMSDLRSGEDEGGLSSSCVVSTGSAEGGGVVGGEEERAVLLELADGVVLMVSLALPLSTSSLDRFIVYLELTKSTARLANDLDVSRTKRLVVS